MTKFIYKWYDEFSKCESLSFSTRAVLHALMHFMGGESAKCWPPIEDIQSRCGASKSTVIRALKDAESSGWLKIERKANCTSRYFASLPYTNNTSVGAMAVPKRLKVNNNMQDSEDEGSGVTATPHGVTRTRHGVTATPELSNNYPANYPQNPLPPKGVEESPSSTQSVELVIEGAKAKTRSSIERKQNSSKDYTKIEATWKAAFLAAYPNAVFVAPTIANVSALRAALKRTEGADVPFVAWCVENWEGMRAHFAGMNGYPALPSMGLLVKLFDRFVAAHADKDGHYSRVAAFNASDPKSSYVANLIRKGHSEYEANRIADQKYAEVDKAKHEQNQRNIVDEMRSKRDEIRRDRAAISGMIDAYRRGDITQKQLEQTIKRVEQVDYSEMDDVVIDDTPFKTWEELEAEEEAAKHAK